MKRDIEPPAIVRGVDNRDERIRAKYQALKHSNKDNAEKARLLGEELAAVEQEKREQHQWHAYLGQCGVPVRVACNCLIIYRNWGILEKISSSGVVGCLEFLRGGKVEDQPDEDPDSGIAAAQPKCATARDEGGADDQPDGPVPVFDGGGEPVGFWTPPDPAADAGGEVEQLDDRPHVHVAMNSGEQEWYTPVEYLNAARAVLGGFDLDPASSEVAQREVKAERFYTKEIDGLRQPWRGRVWMNPPYAAGLVDRFVAKLAEHVGAGDVTEAVVLVNNATDTRWFRQAAAVASAVCFPTGRVRFLDPQGKSGAPLQGQAVLYVGRRKKEFIRAFAAFGFCAEIAS